MIDSLIIKNEKTRTMNYHTNSLKDKINFNAEGYVLIRNFVDKELCSNICKSLESLGPSQTINVTGSRSTYITSKQNQPLQYSGLTYLQKASVFIEDINRIKNLELLMYASTLLGVDDGFFSEDEIHVRQANSAHEIPAHQDNFYFALENPKALTCYVQLTGQEKSSGGLGFLPNSTSATTDEHDPSCILGFSSYSKEIELNRKEDFVYPVTSPGDVIFHHSNTYHRSFANLTSEATASLSIRVFSNKNLMKNRRIQDKYSANLKSNRSLN